MIVWGPPVRPNGEIAGYQVRFIGTFSRTRTVSKAPTETYHVVTISDSSLGSTIQVQVMLYHACMHPCSIIMMFLHDLPFKCRLEQETLLDMELIAAH